MVKYVIDDNEVWNVVEQYEDMMSKIQGFIYGDLYVIRDLRKPHWGQQEIWSGYSFEEMKMQLKTERARAAFVAVSAKMM